MPGTQVVRVESYTRSAMSGVGKEQLRDSESVCRNQEIDSGLTDLNVALKKPRGGSIGSAWHYAVDDIGPGYKPRKDAGVMDQMIITSGPEFFESLGWQRGMGMTSEMKIFFQDAYNWAVAQVGYEGSDRNILAATVHLDETTPHMHIAYIPIAESWRRKVYALDDDGKIRRTAKGSPIVAKDEHGRQIWETVEEPRLSHSEFWASYGGDESEVRTGRRNTSYSLLQDSFQADVGEKWGLERGEIGSDARHESHHKRRTKQAKKELESIKAEVKDVQAAREQIAEERQTIQQDRAKLETEKSAWVQGDAERTERDNWLTSQLAEKQNKLEDLQAKIGDVATAVDLKDDLPAGKQSRRSGKVTYSAEEDARLRRLATTGLEHQRLERNYQDLTDEVQELRAQVAITQKYKSAAERVPGLESELHVVRLQLSHAQREVSRLERRFESFVSTVVLALKTMGSKFRAAFNFVRGRFRDYGYDDLADRLDQDLQQSLSPEPEESPARSDIDWER